jgi:hypothetical protein
MPDDAEGIPRHFFQPSSVKLSSAIIVLSVTLVARADDISAPVILQYFESRYATIENRMPDIFNVGYGNIYTPPPGRADQGSFSVGYDQYDRFDLGKPGNPTLYGTETGLRKLVDTTHKAFASYTIDLVLNHNGFSDLGTNGFYDAGGYPGFNITLPSAIDGDFHGKFESGDLNGRLAGLIDIDHSTNFQMIRSPVPGFANNIRAGTTPAFGRIANVPDENNRRFYPDKSLQPIMVFDPKTGEANIPIYPFNSANPLAGDPVPENALGYLMRNAQWLVQSVGVDGFRLDAEKHYDPFVLNYFDRAVYRSSLRPLLDGSQRQVFSFGEAFTSDQNLLQSLVRKDINPASPGTVGGNRDVLDFPLFFALRDNLTGNGVQNSWYNVRNASFDVHDDGAHNGSQGVTFVSSHDDNGAYLSNVAHAYTLMLPGNAIVYFNAKEFGDNRDFPKDGRGDALGGVYGNAIPTLVDLRNRYGRGNYRERWIEKELFAYERSNSAIVLLSNRLDAGYDSRTLNTDFAPGTRLIELTGNAASSNSDPNNDIPELITVNADKTINVRFLRNTAPGTTRFTGNGYLIYGLATPQGTLSLTSVAQTLAGGTPTAATNAQTRLADIKVIKANSFQVQLNTTAVNLLGNPAFREKDADGDNALVRIDDGIDLNNNGHVDHVTPGSTSYGFDDFLTTRSPGYSNVSGNGSYAQTVDATKLSEGMHFITVRAYRHRGDGGPAVFTDFKQSVYVDRLKPISAVDSFEPYAGGAGKQDRDLYIRSTDQTADNVHIFFDLPAALTEQQILAMVGGNSQADRMDRDLFKKGKAALVRGNHVATVVTYEMTGTNNVQRFAGLFADSPLGKGVGDLNHDGQYAPTDVANAAGAFEQILYSQNAQFDAAADVNGDGKIDNKDLYALKSVYQSGGASQATLDALKAATLRRGDLNHDGQTNAADIDYLSRRLAQPWSWDNDLDSDGAVSNADADTLVQTILGKRDGDANLDGVVDFNDLVAIAQHYNTADGNQSWANGDFTHDGNIDFNDLVELAQNYNTAAPADGVLPVAFAADFALAQSSVPEPAVLTALALTLCAIRRKPRITGAPPVIVASASVVQPNLLSLPD